MRYIGRIISPTKIEGLSEFIEVTKDTSSIKNNETKIPTLIIGYKNAEAICGPGLKFLDRKISENLYWTFSKRERRTDYENDLRLFINAVSVFLMKYCKYEYVDMITASDETKEQLFTVLKDTSHKKIVHSTDTMYYIYVPSDNKIYGISREVLSFLPIGNDVEKLLCDKCVFLVNNADVSTEGIAKSKFILPLLHYLKNF